jgi:hypothetical protein
VELPEQKSVGRLKDRDPLSERRQRASLREETEILSQGGDRDPLSERRQRSSLREETESLS